VYPDKDGETENALLLPLFQQLIYTPVFPPHSHTAVCVAME